MGLFKLARPNVTPSGGIDKPKVWLPGELAGGKTRVRLSCTDL